ncbi:hypothetical protein [Paenibacillus odorifer]|uniref:hypothetical protein n=1 Tax=Paenibacillus odorifer TaxID=189426 RepID=UPI0015C2D98D|nr:hypothetical protein [Paenibacillus odorifer]
MTKTESIFNELGISTREINGEGKKFGAVWFDFINVWTGLSKNEKAELLLNLELN